MYNIIIILSASVFPPVCFLLHPGARPYYLRRLCNGLCIPLLWSSLAEPLFGARKESFLLPPTQWYPYLTFIFSHLLIYLILLFFPHSLSFYLSEWLLSGQQIIIITIKSSSGYRYFSLNPNTEVSSSKPKFIII